ncbi:MAG TPA: hypothetical protein VFB13_06260 [Reyranella sp.]|nr:hypothetical protein [Reyranella sp.]
MGAFTAACLLAMAGAFLASLFSEDFEGLSAMSGGWFGAVTGAIVGTLLALWLILRRGGIWGGRAVAGLTGTAIMMVVCLAFVAFS